MRTWWFAAFFTPLRQAGFHRESSNPACWWVEERAAIAGLPRMAGSVRGGGTTMTAAVAKLFMSGRSQAVRLPKELRFAGESVIARRFGNGVLLLPADAPWHTMQEALNEFEPGFSIERAQPTDPQAREDWPA